MLSVVGPFIMQVSSLSLLLSHTTSCREKNRGRSRFPCRVAYSTSGGPKTSSSLRERTTAQTTSRVRLFRSGRSGEEKQQYRIKALTGKRLQLNFFQLNKEVDISSLQSPTLLFRTLETVSGVRTTPDDHGRSLRVTIRSARVHIHMSVPGHR